MEYVGPDPTLQRGLRRVVAGKYRRVSSAFAERILDRFDTGLWEVYPDAEPELGLDAWCPECDEIVTPRADGTCLWCDTQTGGAVVEPVEPGRSVPWGMRLETLEEARVLYLSGLSMPKVAQRLLDQTTYKSAKQMCQSLYKQFRLRGWPTRGAAGWRVANRKHGLTGRRKGKPDWAAYRRWREEQGLDVRAPRCSATTRRGRPCKLPAWRDGRCRAHHPDRRAEVAAPLARARGAVA